MFRLSYIQNLGRLQSGHRNYFFILKTNSIQIISLCEFFYLRPLSNQAIPQIICSNSNTSRLISWKELLVIFITFEYLGLLIPIVESLQHIFKQKRVMLDTSCLFQVLLERISFSILSHAYTLTFDLRPKGLSTTMLSRGDNRLSSLK